MNREIENIIKNYSYFELNDNQKALISEWASNSDEFQTLKTTLLAADELSFQQEKELNPTIKQRLDVRFSEKYDNNRLVWYNKLFLFLWPEKTSFYKKPLVQFTAIALIAVIAIRLIPEQTQKRLALNEEVQKDTLYRTESENEIEDKIEEKVLHTEKSLKNKSLESSEDRLENVEEIEGLKEERVIIKEELNKIAAPAQEQGWSLKKRDKTVDDQTAYSGAERSSDMDMDVLEEVEAGASETIVDNISPNEPGSDQSQSKRKVSPEETLDLLVTLY